MPALRPTGREDPRATAERSELDPGVVGEHPSPRGPDGAAVPGLDPGVVQIGRPILLREVHALEQVELPVRKEHLELRQLVRVARAERRGQRRHRTPITYPAAALVARCSDGLLLELLQILDAGRREIEQLVEPGAVERDLLGR